MYCLRVWILLEIWELRCVRRIPILLCCELTVRVKENEKNSKIYRTSYLFTCTYISQTYEDTPWDLLVIGTHSQNGCRRNWTKPIFGLQSNHDIVELCNGIECIISLYISEYDTFISCFNYFRIIIFMHGQTCLIYRFKQIHLLRYNHPIAMALAFHG